MIKKVSGHLTPGIWLICIFSRWPPLKILMYSKLFTVGFRPIDVLATDINMGFLNQIDTRSQAIARIADRTASQQTI